ncbi:hypothetical protein [Streptomyces sp. TRM70350]|uniref:hypothetical protein n=1 Tax=Streptomyces sp. TRM70350 TaxID=2856165 RepID=UPI002110A139|nr:hypothetical protein [Streptomyces sp. TRM70350]
MTATLTREPNQVGPLADRLNGILASRGIDPGITAEEPPAEPVTALELADACIPARYRRAMADQPQVTAWADEIARAGRPGPGGPGIAEGPSLLIAGPTGTGKTYQAYGAIRGLLSRGVRLRWEATTTADLRHYRPDVVVTYDENGFYGHPDHIQAHRITMAALEMTALTPKVYWTTMPRSMMQRFGEIMREFHPDMPEPDPAEAAALAEIGLPDDEITTWVDTTAFSGQKFDALAAHASQGENIFFLKMGKERFGELMGMETFVRVQDATGEAVPENDLFAGLR